jgi:hypothetical protein
MVNLDKAKHCALLLTVSLFATLFFVQKTNFMASDLGRHLTNGKVVLATKQPISTNLYSYTHPEQPFIAHHWGFGVLALGVYKLAGFAGLTIVNAALFFVAITLLLSYVSARLGWPYTLLGYAVTLPLLTYRTEIRPETLSMLFCVLALYSLTSRMRLPYKVLLSVVLQAVWVNVHVFFVFGPILSVVYLVSRIRLGLYREVYITLVVLVGQLLATLVNPYGLRGAVYPLHILTDYGYRVAENQTPFLLLRVAPGPVYYQLLAAGALVVVLLALTYTTAFKQRLFFTLATIMFLAGSLKMVRIMPYFGLFALVSVAYAGHALTLAYGQRLRQLLTKPLVLTALGGAGCVVSLVLGASNLYNPFNNFGVGLMPNVANSAKFFTDTKLQGPIFNNYDAGGYLIFYLYPHHKVFVDNRPEAYPSSFFSTEYVPMQEQDEVWAKVSSTYNFNVIYFYRRDYTPWAQPFLIARLKDPAWAPVYVDDYALILVKRHPSNATVIQEHELPQALFSY